MAKASTTVAETLRAAREKRKLTQAQVAAELGVTQPCVAKWEAGGYVRTEDVRAVAAVYGLKPEQLLPEIAA